MGKTFNFETRRRQKKKQTQDSQVSVLLKWEGCIRKGVKYVPDQIRGSIHCGDPLGNKGAA